MLQSRCRWHDDVSVPSGPRRTDALRGGLNRPPIHPQPTRTPIFPEPRTGAMSTPDLAATSDTEAPQPKARRGRRPARFAVALFVAAGFIATLTGCSPQDVARAAIEPNWGGNTNCAMRIVARESNYQADAVNRSSGATGLFQMMPQHAGWIRAEMGYSFSDMKDAGKNAAAAQRLSQKAYRQTRDGWWPWRIGGQARPGGGCPA